MRMYNICMILLGDTSTYDYSFPITLEDGTVTNLYTADEFKTIISNQYTSFGLLSPSYWDTDRNQLEYIINDVSEAREQLHKLYTIWLNDRKPAIERLVLALRKSYNPIWNVDGVTGTVHQETHTGTDTDKKTGTDKIHDTLGSGTITNSGTSKNVKTGNETMTPSGKDIDINLAATYDDSDFNNATKSEKSFSDRTDTHTYNQVTDEYSIDPNDKLVTSNDMEGDHDTTYDSELKKTLNLKDEMLDMQIRQGNIGVTSTQSLLRQQIDLTELDDIISYAIHDFVHRYLVIE